MSNVTRQKLEYPAIPDAQAEVNSLRASVAALKEAVELLTGQRGNLGVSAVSYNKLVELKLITVRDIPR